jgi:hypothetical protein
MGRERKARDAKAAVFKRVYGMTPDMFHKMGSSLQKEFDTPHKRGADLQN